MNVFRWVSTLTVLSFGLSLVLNARSNAAEQQIEGAVTAVTVYRDQARVIRELTVPASQELQQIRVPGLPSQVVVRSAFAEADENTTVRNMRLVARTDNADPAVAERLEGLRVKQDELHHKLRAAEHDAKAIEQDLLTLDKLVDFSAEKVKQNLDRATLDVPSVTALADFTMQRRRALAEEFLEAQDAIDKLKKDIDENSKQQQKVASETVSVSHEALLGVLSPGGGTVRLAYLVGNVNWLPRYSVRSLVNDQGNRVFSLQLDAVLVQDSGEPWNDVALTLATSTPDRQVERPLLTPLRVKAVEPGQKPVQQVERGNLLVTQPDWLERQMMEQNVQLNLLAGRTQVQELTSVAQVQRKIAEDAGEDVSGESYQLETRVSIANHPQLQTISILSDVLSGEMHHVVTPLLSSFAFREAQLTNTSGHNLIAGGAEVYLDGEFVGQTTLSPTAAGQRLTIGFGIDRQIRTRRELLSKEETVQGGNRRSTLKHRLVISNFHDQPVAVRLLDRIPIAAKDGSISVDVEPGMAESLSKDPLYVRMQRPTGVLRWDLEIPAKKFGSDAFDHEYAYSIELDRQQTIISDDIAQTQGDLQFQKMNMGGGMGGGGSF